MMKTKGEQTKIVSGIADGSRLGFKGTEDIGGGFKAIFNLEARIELDTGTQTPTLINNNDGLYLLRGMARPCRHRSAPAWPRQLRAASAWPPSTAKTPCSTAPRWSA